MFAAAIDTIFLEAKSVDDIKLGDLIELSRLRGLYCHWAVYVGDGDVIHLSPPPSKTPAAKELCSAIAATTGVTSLTGDVIDTKLFGSIRVRRDKLAVVAAGSAIVVNNECDTEMTPYPGEVIVKRAESKLGTNAYNPVKWNCEHFATWCRYGKAISKQVPSGLGLSKDAYLVRLPGTEVIPPGTLPNNIAVRIRKQAVARARAAEVIPPGIFPLNIAVGGIAAVARAVEAKPSDDESACILM